MRSEISRYWPSIAIFTLIIFAFLLRIYHLGFQDYFSEELFTVDMIHASYWQIGASFFTNPQIGNPPAYFLLAKLSSDLLGGISLVSIRLTAAILGTACIPAIYALGKEYHSELAGILAAFVVAVSERGVFYSQYGRPYTLVFLFFIFTGYCFVKLEREGVNRFWIAAFSVGTALCLWSHYYSIVPLSVLWIILIWQGWRSVLHYLVIAFWLSLSAALYFRVVIFNYLTIPVSALYPASVFNVTWMDNLFWVPYECLGYAALALIPLFLICLWKAKDPLPRYFACAAGITYLSMLAFTVLFDPSARYAALVFPLVIVPVAGMIADVVMTRKTIAQKIVVAGGFCYLIFSFNLIPLISWFTTSYHFTFVTG